MTQLTLFNEKISDEQLIPITMEITFEIDENSLFWNGKAYPHVSSGCSFGGATSIKDDYKKRIEELVAKEKQWLKDSYGRSIKEKITIVDKRENASNRPIR